MNYSVKYTRHAKADLHSIVRYYREVAEHVVPKLRAEIRYIEDNLQNLPFLYQPMVGEVRRVHLHVFPYTIYYRVKEDRVEIGAILPQKMNPTIIQQRVLH